MVCFLAVLELLEFLHVALLQPNPKSVAPKPATRESTERELMDLSCLLFLQQLLITRPSVAAE